MDKEKRYFKRNFIKRNKVNIKLYKRSIRKEKKKNQFKK